jgi:hypothetical protein
LNLDSGLAKDIKPNGFVYSYGWEFISVDLTSDAKSTSLAKKGQLGVSKSWFHVWWW